MTDIVGGSVGPETKYKVEIEGGKLKLTLLYDGQGMDGTLVLMLEPDYFLDALAAAIPGRFDDSLFDLLKAALK